MRFIVRSNTFKKSYHLVKKRGKDLSKIQKVIALLAQDLPLPHAYKDHALTGNLTGLSDIHIEPDWLLVYYKKEATYEHPEGILHLEITGTHSDLF